MLSNQAGMLLRAMFATTYQEFQDE